MFWGLLSLVLPPRRLETSGKPGPHNSLWFQSSPLGRHHTQTSSCSSIQQKRRGSLTGPSPWKWQEATGTSQEVLWFIQWAFLLASSPWHLSFTTYNMGSDQTNWGWTYLGDEGRLKPEPLRSETKTPSEKIVRMKSTGQNASWIPASVRLKQEDPEFGASLSFIVWPCIKINRENRVAYASPYLKLRGYTERILIHGYLALNIL